MAEQAQWLATCQKEQLRRLQDLSMHHSRERVALELVIEARKAFRRAARDSSRRVTRRRITQVKPLESSFSPQLLELMAKEEAAQHNPRGSHEMLTQIAARVDERLCSETRRYFAQQGEHNQKRWVALFNKQAGERNRLSTEIMQHLSATCERLGLSPPVFVLAGGKGASLRTRARESKLLRKAPPTPPPRARRRYAPLYHTPHLRAEGGNGAAVPETEEVDEFDEEERAIRKHAHDCLAENEQFNLRHAFGLQFARVDSEWSSYEAQMKFEFETQRAALEGKRQQSTTSECARARFARRR